MLKVAIIDSGIDITHKRFTNCNFSENYSFVNGSSPIEVIDDHGTSVFDMIQKGLKANNSNINEIRFYNYQVFKYKDQIDEECIIEAIKRCILQKIDVLNISIGFISETSPQKLYDVFLEAYKNNIICIAAADNSNRRTYPAYFPFVYGVNAGIIDSLTDFGIVENSPVEMVGKGNVQRLASLNNACLFKAGSSYATGHITGIIASIIQGHRGLTFEGIKTILLNTGKRNIKLINTNTGPEHCFIMSQKENWERNELKSNTIEKYFNQSKKFGNIQKVLIYPYSIKEFSGIDKFSDIFKFDIIDVFDFPRMAIGKKEIFVQDKRLKIKWNIKDIDPSVDTFVLGYPNELAIELNHKFYIELLEYAILHRKNIFTFDKNVLSDILNHPAFCPKEFTNKIFHPALNPLEAKELTQLNTITKVTKPVVCVIGTTAKVGKFTLQLKLKKALENEGYKTGWLSSEPQGELFGADFCFPFGHDSTISIDPFQWHTTLDSIVKGIEVFKKPDIIITGHQSGFLPLSKNLIGEDIIKNMLFISGVKPDAVILAINANDDIRLLQRFVDVFKAYYEIPILFISLSRQKKEIVITNDGFPPIVKNSLLSDMEWNDKAEQVSSQFRIPVIDAFSNTSDSTIIQCIESFF